MNESGINLQIGGTLSGRYRIVSDGAAYDIGTRCTAYDIPHDRLVDLLLLARRFGTGIALLERLTRANQVVADLAQAALVPFDHIGLVEGQPYLVRRHLEGQTLAELLAKTGFLDTGAAVSIASQICTALAPAHRAGLVHGSLSPHSVLIAADGQILIADMGLLPALQPVPAPQGRPWGRFPYISPEQADGEEAHPATDVYLVGSLLYEMLTGRNVFVAADETGLALQHLRQEPVPLQVRVPQLPPALAQIVHRALAKEPAMRYRNAGQLAHILKAQLSAGLSVPTPSHSKPAPEHLTVPAPPLPLVVHPDQEDRPLQETRPTQVSRPPQEVRPLPEVHPAAEMRPAQETRPPQEVRPPQETRPAQETRPPQEVRPPQETRPAQETHPLQEVRPPQEAYPSREDDQAAAPSEAIDYFELQGTYRPEVVTIEPTYRPEAALGKATNQPKAIADAGTRRPEAVASAGPPYRAEPGLGRAANQPTAVVGAGAYRPYAVTEQWTEFVTGEPPEEPVRMNWMIVALIIAALTLVLGLIPLWRTVYRHYAAPPALPTPVTLRSACGLDGASNKAVVARPFALWRDRRTTQRSTPQGWSETLVLRADCRVIGCGQGLDAACRLQSLSWQPRPEPRLMGMLPIGLQPCAMRYTPSGDII